MPETATSAPGPEDKRCTKCGRELPFHQLCGHCPECLLELALAQLERDEVNHGRGAHFKRLQVFLMANDTHENRRAAAADLGMTPDAAGMAVYRLRRRFGEALRAQISATVELPQVQEELRSLRAALLAVCARRWDKVNEGPDASPGVL